MDPERPQVIVIDSSYALALVLPNATRPASAALVFGQALAAPALWPIEIANALRNSVRRRRFKADEAIALCREVGDWEVMIAALAHDDPARHLEFAQAHDLTPYDAQYLALALQRSAALATRDAALGRAATRVGLLVHR